MTRAVALWLAQSLLGAGVVIGWLAATRRAKRLGADFLERWLLPWRSLWTGGHRALVIVELVAAVLYAICSLLARAA